MRTMRKLIVLLLLAALLLSGCAAGSPFIRVREKTPPADSAAPELPAESPDAPTPSPEPTPTAAPLCVVIDPGHQRTGDAERISLEILARDDYRRGAKDVLRKRRSTGSWLIGHDKC